MCATPTAFRLRVFTEAPALFLGLRGIPLIHFLAGPRGPGRKLVPGDKPEDNDGGRS